MKRQRKFGPNFRSEAEERAHRERAELTADLPLEVGETRAPARSHAEHNGNFPAPACEPLEVIKIAAQKRTRQCVPASSPCRRVFKPLIATRQEFNRVCENPRPWKSFYFIRFRDLQP